MNKIYTLLLLVALFCETAVAQKGVVIAPDSGEPATQLSVSITGINTTFGSGTYTLDFYKQGSQTSQIAANGFQVTSNNTLEATLFIKGSATSGVYTYKLNNTFTGIEEGLAPFYVSPPANRARIVAVNPGVGHINQSLNVSVSGLNTRFTQGSQTASFFRNGSPTSQLQITSINVENDSLLNLNVNIANNQNIRGFYDLVLNAGNEVLYKLQCFEVTWALGVKDATVSSAKVRMYPNPATSKKIQIESEEALIKEIEIVDIQGRLVQTEKPEVPEKKVAFVISDFVLPNQYLIVKIVTNKGVVFERLLIQ
ncbi:MAG: T9SS type A sorting domain-containing protein [Bacteroidia bacterium]|nr:T9SS type A sorting domain-containing protein [Bacteroidia bacterium]